MAEFGQLGTSKIQNNKPQDRQVEQFDVVANPVRIREEVIAKSNENMQLLVKSLQVAGSLSQNIIQKTETENTKTAVNKMFEIENSGRKLTEEDYKQIEKDTGIFINSDKVEEAYRDITSNRMLTDGKKVISNLKESEWDNNQETQDRFGGNFSDFYNTRTKEISNGYIEELAGTNDPKFVYDYVNKFNQFSENNYNSNIKPIEDKKRKEEQQLMLKENFTNILDTINPNNIEDGYKTLENNIKNVKTAIGEKYSTVVPEFVNSLLIKAEETGDLKYFELAKKMNIDGFNVYDTNREAFIKMETRINNTKTERSIVEQNIYDERVKEGLYNSIKNTNMNEEDYKRNTEKKFLSDGKKISNTILNEISDNFKKIEIETISTNVFTDIIDNKISYNDLKSSLNISDNNSEKRKKIDNIVDNTYNFKQEVFYKNGDIANIVNLNRKFEDKEIESYSILNDFNTITNIKDTELNNIDPKQLDETIKKLNQLHKNGVNIKGVDETILSVFDSEAFQKTPLELKAKALSNLTKYKENKEYKEYINEQLKEDIKNIYTDSDIPSYDKDNFIKEYKNHYIITGLKKEYKEVDENKSVEIEGIKYKIGFSKELYDKFSEVNDENEMIFPLDYKNDKYLIINKDKFINGKVIIPFNNKIYSKKDFSDRYNKLKKTENTTLGTVVDTSRNLGGYIYDILNPQEKQLTPEEIKRKQEIKKKIDATEEQIVF